MPRSRQEQKGATPLNSTVHPTTRSVSKQITEADTVQSITDNFQQDIGLILLDNNTDSTTVSNNTDSGEESDIEDNISVNSNSSIILFNLDLDSEMASGLSLQKFSDESCCVPAIWWNLFESYRALHNVDNNKALSVLPLQLTGHASLWFHNLDANTKGNIDNLKAAFLARFSNTKTNQQIYKLQQTSIESSQAYLARVHQLAMGAENLGEAVIVDIAVNGLQPSLKQTVIQKSPKTFEELRNSLEIATNVAECASSNTPCTSQDINAMFSSFLESMKSAVKQEVSEVMAVTPHPTQTQNYPERQETRQYKQEYVCFGCGKSCTNRRLCPAFNVKCFKCDRVGHFKEAHIICDSDTIFIPDSCSNTLNALELNSGLARTVSGTFIPPFHQANIPISVSSIKNQIALLEPLPSLPKMSPAGAKCCVSLDDSNQSCLRIMNPTKDKIFLPANYVVAAVTPVNSEDIISMSEDNDKVQNPDNSKSKVHTEKGQNVLQFDLSNSDLTEEQKDLLTIFLHKNRKVFAENLSELGRTHMYQHVIETDDAPPVRKRFYRQTPQVFEAMNRQIEQMLKYDIIEESNSEWQSPVVMCKKKSGEMSRSFEEHLNHLQLVFDKLISAGLTLKPGKCLFARKEVIYLGHTISKEGVKVDTSKVDAVSSFPVPKNQKQIRSFLGLTNYYRKFIEGYSHITTPLNHLLGNDVPFEWSEKCQKAFDQLKKALCSAPILAYPNMSKPFILTTDASGTAIGYILGKKNGNADCLSRREYSDFQSSSEPEDVIPSVNLTSISSQENSEPLQVNFVYTPTNTIPSVMAVDAENTDDTVIETNPEPTQIQETHTEVMPENIGPLQKECFDFKHVYAYLENGTLPDETKLAKKICLEASQYALLDGILYHFYQPRTRGRKKDLFVKQLACPRQFRNDLLKSYHEIGHFGFDRTYLAIKNKYFFPGMYQAVADFIRGCDSCQRAKPHVHAKRVPLTPMPITDTFARWHIDLIGPFKETKLGHRHVLIVVCAFSKWTEAFPVRSETAEEIANVLHKEVFSRYGSPTSLVSDRGQGFMSKLVAAVTQIYNVKHYFTSSYHPQTNSVAERTNKTVIQCLRTIVDENQSNCAELLPGILMAFRMSPSASSEFSPYHLLFGKEMNLPVDTTLLPKTDINKNLKVHIENIIDCLKIAKRCATDNLKYAQEKQKKRYDKNTALPKFEIQDLVLMYSPKVPVGLASKLHRKQDGPFYIAAKGLNHTYKLRRCEDNKMLKSMINANRLKLYTPPDHRPDQNAPPPDVPRPDPRREEQPNFQNPVPPPNPNNDENVPNPDADISDTDEPVDDGSKQFYDVEKLVQSKKVNNEQQFLVKWVGYREKTWEPEQNLPIQMVRQYLATKTQKGTRRRKRKRNNILH
ncbi:Retrovirus-related Pol polyprotein from transposon 297 [Mytilus coruscus]|uniref:Retrovirus-related Pol polyprotein from transposon 297 n=1 Tax=Mytilus coruscus TaxID=42192 RepID=A0A6J8EZW0_MYTCO|nr:Retrovirus-related Pol polyprotein from transposon 297 [Mytilus coruscus]